MCYRPIFFVLALLGITDTLVALGVAYLSFLEPLLVVEGGEPRVTGTGCQSPSSTAGVVVVFRIVGKGIAIPSTSDEFLLTRIANHRQACIR